MSAPDEPYLTTAEVAPILRVTPKTVGIWANAKKIPGIKLGGVWLFTPQAIRDLVEPKPKDIWEQPKRALVNRGRAA